jgi:GNAT superfamily N-acetyltransferase
MEWHDASYTVSDDRARLDARAIHDYLSRSYWAMGIPLEIVQRSLAHSLNLGLYVTASGEQVGLARVVTDRATFAYLCDVYVLEPHRGRGLSKFLMRCVRAHPDLQQLRRMLLVTADAHGLYAQFGFQPLSRPERVMESADPEIYSRR